MYINHVGIKNYVPMFKILHELFNENVKKCEKLFNEIWL